MIRIELCILLACISLGPCEDSNWHTAALQAKTMRPRTIAEAATLSVARVITCLLTRYFSAPESREAALAPPLLSTKWVSTGTNLLIMLGERPNF